MRELSSGMVEVVGAVCPGRGAGAGAAHSVTAELRTVLEQWMVVGCGGCGRGASGRAAATLGSLRRLRVMAGCVTMSGRLLVGRDA